MNSDWRDKHYSFFQNRACEYFPCHPGADPEDFNCLFCYCPLYALGERCGGAYRRGADGLKDCTACLFPHRRENYGKIVGRFAEVAALARVGAPSKRALRAEIRDKKRALREEQIVSCSARLAEQLFAHPAYQTANSIYGYLSYNQEVRTGPILARARRDGKRVAVPKVFGGEEMRFLWLDDLAAVAPGAYGIPEPVADGPEADDPHALILMPGLAFDREGRRCGYGGGFYDRWLPAHPGHPLLALCYDFQLFERLQTDPHDIPVDYVLAEPV